MRRTFFALLGAASTMATLIGGRCIIAPPAGDGHNEAKAPSPSKTTSERGPSSASVPGPSATSSPSPSVSYTPRPNQAVRSGASRSGASTKPPSAGGGNPQYSGGGSSGNGSSGSSGSSSGNNSSSSSSSSSSQPPEPSCGTFDGDNVPIGEIGGDGIVFVTIKVCDGALVDVGGGVMMSNYEPTNTEAVAALNQLAVQYYKSDMSMITYSGATVTAVAYRTSLQSAMTLAGL